MKSNKLHKKIIISAIIIFCILVAGSLSRFFCESIPFFDGIWANEDKNFVLDTNNATAIITSPNGSEIFTFIFHPETNFHMYYPLPEEAVSVSDSDDIHKGEIYRIKFFGIDYIHAKCDNGCFDVYLTKNE